MVNVYKTIILVFWIRKKKSFESSIKRDFNKKKKKKRGKK